MPDGPASSRGLQQFGAALGLLPDRLGAHDRPGPLPAALAELAAEMDAVIARYGPLGSPLWPVVASSAYAALLSGEEKLLFCALTWDTSPSGWTALARWWTLAGPEPVLHSLLLVGTWPVDWDVSEQPFRKALGGALALETSAQAFQINLKYIEALNYEAPATRFSAT